MTPASLEGFGPSEYVLWVAMADLYHEPKGAFEIKDYLGKP